MSQPLEKAILSQIKVVHPRKLMSMVGFWSPFCLSLIAVKRLSCLSRCIWFHGFLLFEPTFTTLFSRGSFEFLICNLQSGISCICDFVINKLWHSQPRWWAYSSCTREDKEINWKWRTFNHTPTHTPTQTKLLNYALRAFTCLYIPIGYSMRE